MSAAGHTPGPWSADSEFGALITGSNGTNVAATLNQINATKRQHPVPPLEEVKANARLIIAAPDLLAELDVRIGDLVMLRRAIEEGDPKAELLFRIDDMLRETRAAIAKAQP